MPLDAGSIVTQLKLVTREFEKRMNRATRLYDTMNVKLADVKSSTSRLNTVMVKQAQVQTAANATLRTLNTTAGRTNARLTQVATNTSEFNRTINLLNRRVGIVSTAIRDMTTTVRRNSTAMQRNAVAARASAVGIAAVSRTASATTPVVASTTASVGGLSRMFTLAGVSAAVANKAINLLSRGFSILFSQVPRGISVIDEFRKNNIAIAASLTSMAKAGEDPVEVFQQMFRFATETANVLEILAAQSLVTGEQLNLAFRAFAQRGIVPVTEKDLRNMRTLTEVAVLFNKQIGGARQVTQEILGFLDGVAKAQSDVLAITIKNRLEQLGSTKTLKEQLAFWRELGTNAQGQNVLLEESANLLSGFQVTQNEVLKLTSTWQNALKTINDKMLRQAMLPLYEDLSNLLEGIGKSLFENNRMTDLGLTIIEATRIGYFAIRSAVIGIVGILKIGSPLIFAILNGVVAISSATALILEGWNGIIKFVSSKIFDEANDGLNETAERINQIVESTLNFFSPAVQAAGSTTDWAEEMQKLLDLSAAVGDETEKTAKKIRALTIQFLSQSKVTEDRAEAVRLRFEQQRLSIEKLTKKSKEGAALIVRAEKIANDKIIALFQERDDKITAAAENISNKLVRTRDKDLASAIKWFTTLKNQIKDLEITETQRLGLLADAQFVFNKMRLDAEEKQVKKIRTFRDKLTSDTLKDSEKVLFAARATFEERKLFIEENIRDEKRRSELIIESQQAANREITNAAEKNGVQIKDLNKEMAKAVMKSWNDFFFSAFKLEFENLRGVATSFLDAILRSMTSFLASRVTQQIAGIFTKKPELPFPGASTGGEGASGISSFLGLAGVFGGGGAPGLNTPGGPIGPALPSSAEGGGILSSIGSFFSRILPFQIGGTVPSLPGGGKVLASLEPGERVIPPGGESSSPTIVNILDPRQLPRALAGADSQDVILNAIGGVSGGVRRIGLS